METRTKKNWPLYYLTKAKAEHEGNLEDFLGGAKNLNKAIDSFFEAVENTEKGSQLSFSQPAKLIANHLLVKFAEQTYEAGFKAGVEAKSLRFKKEFAIYDEDGNCLKGGVIYTYEYQDGYNDGLNSIAE